MLLSVCEYVTEVVGEPPQNHGSLPPVSLLSKFDCKSEMSSDIRCRLFAVAFETTTKIDHQEEATPLLINGELVAMYFA